MNSICIVVWCGSIVMKKVRRHGAVGFF